MRRLTGLAAGTALLLATLGAAPAEARGRHHHGGGHHGGDWGHHHDDGIDAGDVIGGLFVIGAIAAIASAASKDSRDGNDDRYEPPYPDEPRDADYRDARETPDMPRYTSNEIGQRATDACSWAAEAEAGEGARVQSISGTRPDVGYGVYVTGDLSRPGERTRSFGCTYSNGRVTDVRVN
jgi:hypothetical protein